ncbi:MAG: hypothetical protein ACFCUP_09365, partial [Actinomycetales bacterium]
PPRRDEDDPGAARSLHGAVAVISGPGDWELVAHQLPPAAHPPPGDAPEATDRVPPVPEHLREVAAALCEPLLHGSRLPAAYSEIARRAGLGTIRRARNRVAELTTLYLDEIPLLQERVDIRRERAAAEFALDADLRLQGGVWRMDQYGSAEQSVGRRRHALALPDYFEVAHLLVRRHLVTRADLANLPAAPAVSDHGDGR